MCALAGKVLWNVTAELTEDLSMRSFFLDLTFVFRQLRKSPGFTATAVLMLAASALPALNAASIDSIQALRGE